MEIFRPEVHAVFLQPFLDHARDDLGADRLTAILAEFGVAEEQLREPSAWVSLDFSGALRERIWNERKDPALYDQCGRLALSPRYLRILRPLLRSFGTPMFAYHQIVQATPRFNKVGWMRILAEGPGLIEIEYQPLPGAPRERPAICQTRTGQLRAVPTLFDSPPAAVDHSRCMHHGDASCVYRLTWTESGRGLRALSGPLVGLAAGAGVARAAALPVGAGAAVIALGGAIGWLVGHVLALRARLRERASVIYEYRDALTRSVRSNEDRYVELMAAKAEVEQADRAKTDFFANVSHELRTPLTLILGPLEDLLAGREPPGGLRAALEVMARNADRLLLLINQLLDVAKVDAGRARLALASVDCGALVRAVCARFAAAAAARGLTIDLQGDDRAGRALLDQPWIDSALTNLLANATRYATARVTVAVRGTPETLVVQVSDDGPGIAKDDLPRVFDRFAQGSDSHARRGGTGLGLAIVQEAARLHGGRATVESEPGRTLFTLELPIERASGAPRESAAEAAPAATARVPAAPAAPAAFEVRGPSPNAARVLVVEDDDDMRGFLATVLSARYHVRTAADGADGVAQAVATRPDVIVSDVAMPGMSGYDLCRSLRADAHTRAIPIVLLTAYRDAARVLEGFEAGAVDFVSKPFHARELLARVEVHVQLQRLVRDLSHSERLAMLGLLAASVAHQARNPLTVIASGLGSVRKRLGAHMDERTTELYDAMVDSVGRIEKLTTDLLDLSRLDRAQIETFRPGDLIAAALRLTRVRLPRGVQVTSDVDDAIELTGRPGDLTHVFLNLLDNAARAVGDAGAIAVRAGPRDGAFVFEVEDSGPGVDADKVEWIFSPFATTRAAGEGTGLGLSIAKQVVEQHGGALRVGDGALGGARFTVTLPLRADVAVAPRPASGAQ